MATPDNGMIDLRRKPVAFGSPEWQAKAQKEIDERPTVLPLDQRKWPYGLPDRMIKKQQQSQNKE